MAGKDDSDDDTGGEDAIAEKAITRHAERVRRFNDEEPDEPDEIELTEPDDDDELDETPKAPGRKEKRANRSTARERAAAAEAESRVLREQLEVARRAPVAAPQAGPPATTEVDSQIRKTFQEEKALLARWENPKATAAERSAMEDEMAEINVRRTDLVFQRRELHAAPQRAEEARVATLRARAPDVYGDPRAYDYAVATFNRAQLAGEKPSMELHDRVMEETRQVIFGKRPAPDKAARARASGMRSGAMPAGTPPARQSISMPKGSMNYRIAVAAYPNLEPREALQKWANGPGKRILAKQG